MGPAPELPFPKKLPRLVEFCFCNVGCPSCVFAAAPDVLPLSLPSSAALPVFFALELPRTLSRTEAVRRLKLDFLAGEFSTLLELILVEDCLGICERPIIEVGFFSEGKYFLICDTCALT